MAKGSGRTLSISLSALPIMTGALDYASMGLIPAGAYRNREFAGTECEFARKNPDNRLSEFLPEESGEQTADALSELAAAKTLSLIRRPQAAFFLA